MAHIEVSVALFDSIRNNHIPHCQLRALY